MSRRRREGDGADVVPIGESAGGAPRRRRGCLFWGLVVGLLLVLGVGGVVVAVIVYNRTHQELVLPPDGRPIPTSPPVTRPGSPVGVSSLDLTQGANRRHAVLLSPPDIAPGERLPLVILLHGHSGNSGVVVSEGGWKQAIIEHRFLVLAPEGVSQSWNAGGCCRMSTALGTDDVAYLDALVQDMAKRPQVDPARISMVGNSNGGMMTYRYLCRHADRIAAAVIVEGTNVAGCEPSAPLPLLHVAGTADRVVPYDGGSSGAGMLLGSEDFPPVVDSVTKVARAMGCAAAPTEDQPRTAVTTRTWTGCRDGATVQLDSIEGQQHAWPKGSPYAATDEALAFLGLTG